MANNPASIAVAQVAYDAGFRGVALVNAVALALAESDGNPNPNALNDNPKTGDYSVGYWQINYYGNLAQQRTQTFGPPSQLRGVDPTGPEARNNAKAAYALSGGGTTWSPWTADFQNGNYYKQLPAAQAAVSQLMGGATAPAAVGSPYQYATSTGLVGAGGVIPESGVGVDTGTGAATTEQDHCLVSTPSLPIVGSFCVMSTNKARAIAGVLLMAAGSLVALAGVAMLTGQTRKLSAVAGTMGGKPLAAIATLPARREERYYRRAERPTPEQTAQAHKAARGTVTDIDGNTF